MSKKRTPALIVRGVKSQRGYPMAWISDYIIDHYELVSDLILDRKAAFARMADRGLIAVGHESYIMGQLADLQYSTEKTIYDSYGWNAGVFVDGTKHIHLPPDATAGDAAFPAPVERFAANGDIEGWLTEVAEPLAGHMIAEFLLSLMFAGALVSFSGQSVNPGFALIGEPEDGKSLLLQIVASACGVSVATNSGDEYPLSFSSTNVGIKEEMQNYADQTIIFDEAAMFSYGMSALQRGKAVIEVIMDLSQGRDKKRFGTKARHSNFCYITTANETFESVVGSSAPPATLRAISTRLSTIELKGRSAGVLDHLPSGFSDKADFLGGLLMAAERHHGVAFPHYIGQLVELVARNHDGFKEQLLKHMADFRVTATRGAPRMASRRVLDAFGLGYAAGRLAQHLGALPATFSPIESALACYRLHLDSTLPPARPVDIVAGLLDDPDVPVLRRKERLDISKKDFQAAKAFILVSGKRTELVMSPESAARLFNNWTKVYKSDPDIRAIMIREGNRPDTYRRIREGKRDRVICFGIRPDWPFRR